MPHALLFPILLLTSFVFAMLGQGGALVFVPVLAWAGFAVKEVAIPLALLLNGLNTLLALIPYARKRLVDWKGGLAMTAAGFAAAPLGAYAVGFVSVRTVLALFAVAVLVAAGRMLLAARQSEPTRMMSLRRRSTIGAMVGGFAGFMSGLLGVGGGFIIAPILIWMGYPTKQAAATTAFVVTFSSLSAYLSHVAGGRFDLTLTITGVAAVAIGSQLGAGFMSTRAKPQWVKGLYAALLLAVGAKLVVGLL
jgi:uncharacterized protein